MPTIVLIALWALVFTALGWLVRQRFALAKLRTEQGGEDAKSGRPNAQSGLGARPSFDDALNSPQPAVKAALLAQGSSIPIDKKPKADPSPMADTEGVTSRAGSIVAAPTVESIVIDREAPPLPTGPIETMAQALAGIVLPCGLAPLTGSILRLESRDRVTFWTDEHDVLVVRAHVMAELRHLGCSVVDFDEITKHVSRGSANFEMRIVGDAAKATIGNDPHYPTAAPDSVVVDFLLR